MARYIGASCKLCRREGIKLHLKGFRCITPKCAIEKRNFAPGQHGRRRTSKDSDYGKQLREKQKMKKTYGMLERPFRLTFDRAARKSGVTGENLIQLLEKRLDNVVYRLVFAASHAEARQLIRHGHVRVNGKKVNIPSFSVKPDDVIELKKNEKIEKRVKENYDLLKERQIPDWLSLEKDVLKATVLRNPTKQDAALPIEESMIVELYSK